MFLQSWLQILCAYGNRTGAQAWGPSTQSSSLPRARALANFASTLPKINSDNESLWTLIFKWNRGFGFFTIFQSALNYLVDTFQKYAASAIAANTFLRSSFAAAFPMFIFPMYHNLGIPWASSVFGFFSVCLIPIPFIFYVYGARIRARGKYSFG